MRNEENGAGTAVAAYLAFMNEQRERIFAELSRICLADLWARPSRGKWSIGEHLDHTRVLNRSFLRLFQLLWPLASPYARLRRGRPYATAIDDVYARPGFPSRVGVLFPPRHRPDRPVSLEVLRRGVVEEHGRIRGFFAARDERLLGQIHLYDPAIGWLNLVQALRVGVHHDEHHFRAARRLQ